MPIGYGARKYAPVAAEIKPEMTVAPENPCSRNNNELLQSLQQLRVRADGIEVYVRVQVV